MEDKKIQDIYNTLVGELQAPYRIPGIENIYATGSLCADAYADMLDAYERLCERLGVIDEDEDVEIIISSLRAIEREISLKMFKYGMEFAKNL